MNENEAVLLWTDEYSRMAETYDARIRPRFAPFAERNVTRAGLKPHSMVLDLSTGTGLTALLAARAMGGTGMVVGVDLADGALAVAQTNAAREGLRNLRFEMMDTRNLVYRGETFDAALTSFGLPATGHMQILEQIHRVLKEGATFHAVLWGPDSEQDGWVAFRETLEEHRTKSPSDTLAQLRSTANLPSSDRAAIRDRAALTDRMRRAGFSRVTSEPYEASVTFSDVDDLIGFHAGFGSVERELSEMGDSGRETFRSALEKRLAEVRADDGIRARWSVNYYAATR